MNNVGLLIKGEYTDTIRYANGDVEVIKGQNLIVDGLLNLVTALLGVKSGYTGLKYWAVGQGNVSWDSSTPEPTTSDTQLTDEIGRKQISASDMKWVQLGGEDSATPTNRLKVELLLVLMSVLVHGVNLVFSVEMQQIHVTLVS